MVILSLSDQLIVTVTPSERQLIAGRPVTFSCLTEPLDCKNFYYFWSYGRQWLPVSMKVLRFTVSKDMSGSSLYCFVKNRENIELGHDSFSLDVINCKLVQCVHGKLSMLSFCLLNFRSSRIFKQKPKMQMEEENSWFQTKSSTYVPCGRRESASKS